MAPKSPLCPLFVSVSPHSWGFRKRHPAFIRVAMEKKVPKEICHGAKQLARQRAVSSRLQIRHLLSPNWPRLTASLTPKGRMKDVFASVGFSGVCFGAELSSHQGFWLASGGASGSWVLSPCTTPASTCWRLPLLGKWEKLRFTKFPSSLIPAVKEAWG